MSRNIDLFIFIKGMIENLLTHHDHTLLAYFIRYKVTSQVRDYIKNYQYKIIKNLFLDLCMATSGNFLFGNI